MQRSAGIKEEEKLEAARPAFGESSAGEGQEDMAPATVTPLVQGEMLHPPQYGEVWNKVASREFLRGLLGL